MRKLIVAEFITLDGFIARPNGEMDFFNEFNDEQVGMEMIKEQQNWGGLLFGKTTYQILSSFWPLSTDSANPVANFMNQSPKNVVSSSLKEAPWGGMKKVEIISKDVTGEIRKLKQASGKDLVILGSAGLVQSLMAEEAIDEFSLWVYPIILGKGKSLFTSSDSILRLKLEETKPFGKGIVLVRYSV